MVLITGHKGYIGSNLHRLLPEAIGLDLKSGEDILTCDLPEASHVIHLAGYSNVHGTMEDCWKNNVECTERLLNHYKHCRILVASSSCAREPYRSAYGMSKYIAESIPHKNCLHMRFTNVYGNGHRPGSFHDLLENGKLEYVTNHIRDFIHVDDLCQWICYHMGTPIKGWMNMGSGTSVKMSDLVDLPIRDGHPYEMEDNSI